ncbi:hypothetical protein BGX38DRAFT_1147122 [Terfezia claveryi]|nr:hypothetical protein BGX38DRAFT_1147122 [Terfezia claveryi]
MNYFDGPKKLGNQDRTFISRITGSFMYLIFAILQHALLTYESGVFKDGDNFNYTNSAVAFGRMREQWGDFPTTLEQSLLKVICIGIVRRCQQRGKVTRWEQHKSYKMERIELEKYADELAADIKDAEDAYLIPVGYFPQEPPTGPDIGGRNKRVSSIGDDADLVEDDQDLLELANDSNADGDGGDSSEDDEGDEDSEEREDNGRLEDEGGEGEPDEDSGEITEDEGDEL